MQFPESWLREFCSPPIDTAALADLLTMGGMEVEDMRPAAPAFTRVVVGDVVAVERHPQADRLSVCKVDAGTGTLLTIVCGAPNVRAGIKVPCALVGAELPPDAKAGGAPLRIARAALRGVESEGMLCSARELGLNDDRPGLLILDSAAAAGCDLREHLRLDDTVFTLKLTPNLGHCLSVYGVAREVSALTGAPLHTPSFPAAAPRHDGKLRVKVEAPDLCGRFSGRVIRNVDTRAATPAWMAERLARCGQRPVSALVDISNYVMFEYGRPTHIFDLDKIRGGLTVRWGRAGETLELLNGATVEVDESVGVIADDEGVESLAGIMGGASTAVSNATRSVYVEAAFWWPQAVAGRSRRYNFSTDAGYRFERGVDPAPTVEHLELITRLIVDICGGEAGPVDDQTLALPQRRPIDLRVERAAKVIGMAVTQPQCADVLRRLGFDVRESHGVLSATPPTWRFDVQIEEDLIEEVIRILGYDTLPAAPATAPLAAAVRSESRLGVHALRQRLAGLDYVETVNFSFVEEQWERDFAANADPVRVLNPIASSLSVMRSGLIGGLVQVLRHNLARKAARVRVFEIGRVFMRDGNVADGASTVAGVCQPQRLAALAYGDADALQWGLKERPVDFFDAKGDVEQLFAPRQVRFVCDTHPALHPGRCARVEVDGRPAGVIGELHPRWRQAYDLSGAPMLFELDLAALLLRPQPRFSALPRQQPVWRDISIVVSAAVTHEALVHAIRSAPAALVRSATLYDVYRPKAGGAGVGAGEQSLTLRLELAAGDDSALTDERIGAAVAQILDILSAQLNVRLRS